ncbi:hypothetical protein [Pseudalkalibacillus hwajinpoensis]|uniref:Uncharacterized protein n=1 Tax=Guptibacillus hwajinpoensis TaxID=208199 RepID=A0A4U1MEA2_9BACL|nr:hypothetical protein [Pseudalkalibacillus hwajinpoensis]TKD68695.1 hypothetical protein FBF83_15950 [Pseudalkalibacillus hwajinpoensis]
MYRENKPTLIGPYDHPDIYPGPRPSSSFLYHKGKAHRIEEKENVPVEKQIVHYARGEDVSGSLAFSSSEQYTVEELVRKEGLTPIEDRIPLLAYGSNVCLAQLRYKFSLNPDLNDFILYYRAEITDTDVVAGSFLAPYGALPAVIAPVKGAKTEVWVTFVDREQLELLNRTEGSYVLREHQNGKLTLKTGEHFERVYAYYYPHAYLRQGSFVRFMDIPGESKLPSMWQADLLNELKSLIGYGGHREEFIHELRWNGSLRKKMTRMLKDLDETFDHPDWIEPNGFHTLKNMTRSQRKRRP